MQTPSAELTNQTPKQAFAIRLAAAAEDQPKCDADEDADYPVAEGEEAVIDKEGKLVVISTDRRVLRGGSFNYQASLVRSSDRSNDVPPFRDYNSGFRPARTFTP